MMEEVLVGYLLSSGSPVETLVSDRIHWTLSPQGSPYPRVVLNRIDGADQYSDEGPVGLVGSRIQIDCYGETYAAAKGVARALKSWLAGPAISFESVEFPGVFPEDEQDSTEVPANGPEKVFRTRLDFLVWHVEQETS